jgi:hypothetical protein
MVGKIIAVRIGLVPSVSASDSQSAAAPSTLRVPARVAATRRQA